MRIAIEAQRIFRHDKHGMDFVALESIRELQRMDTVNQYHILVAPGDDHCLLPTPNFHIEVLNTPTYPLWEQVALPAALRRIKPDLLHCTSNTAPLYGAGVPLLLTLHDVIFLEPRAGRSASWYQNMGWLYRRFVVPRILPRCERIITVSRFERDRIARALDMPPDKLVAIYNGYSSHFKPIEDPVRITRKYFPVDDYLFFLGNTDPKKNTARVLKAYARYADGVAAPLPLVVADLREGVVEELLHQEGISHVRQLLYLPGYIFNRDLPAVYSGARLFIYTSLRESFGIPILEAMACGTPVVTSDVSAMPEIAGPGAMLVDPLDVDAIAGAMTRLLTDGELYARQRDYGLERVKAFSWRQTATHLLELYREITGAAAPSQN